MTPTEDVKRPRTMKEYIVAAILMLVLLDECLSTPWAAPGKASKDPSSDMGLGGMDARSGAPSSALSSESRRDIAPAPRAGCEKY